MELMANKLSVSAVGDISLGDHPVCAGIGMRSAFRKRGSDLLAGVSSYLSETDLTLANLETVTSNAGLRPLWLPSYEMRGNPDALSYIREAGIDVVGVANNHAMQHGAAAFDDMVKKVTSSGIDIIGVDDDGHQSRLYEMAHENGSKSTFFAVSIRPEEWAESTDDLPYSYRESADKLIEDVIRLRAQCDGFLVCSIHWGLEFLDYPSSEQITLGHRLIDAGVDVVFGHHPHVLQPIERYKQGLIFYSLGNFIFDLWPDQTRLTAIAHVNLEKGKQPAYRITPVKINPDFSLSVAIKEDAVAIDNLLSWERYEAMADKPENEDQYRLRYSQERRKFRYSSYQYFLKNLYRYPPWFLVQSLGRTAIRRLTGN